MKNSKMKMYITIILIILFVLLIGILVIKNNKNLKGENIEEYIPEEEITTEQLRATNIKLFFYNEQSVKLEEEIIQIDSKELLENPEAKLLEYLFAGTTSNDLKNIIPENTKLINVGREKNALIINLSEEFINDNNIGIEEQKNIIQSILKTVTQLNEIDSIKILINGEENKSFPNNGISFEEEFKI